MDTDQIITFIRGLLFILLMIAVCVFACCLIDRERDYPLSGIVTEVDYDTNEVEFTDRNGNVWVFEGTEDWELYDTVDVIMNTCGTEIVTDDKIVQIGYSKRRE